MVIEGDAVTDNVKLIQQYNAQLLAQGRAQGLTGNALSQFITKGLNQLQQQGIIKPTTPYETSQAQVTQALQTKKTIGTVALIGIPVAILALMFISKKRGRK